MALAKAIMNKTTDDRKIMVRKGTFIVCVYSFDQLVILKQSSMKWLGGTFASGGCSTKQQVDGLILTTWAVHLKCLLSSESIMSIVVTLRGNLFTVVSLRVFGIRWGAYFASISNKFRFKPWAIGCYRALWSSLPTEKSSVCSCSLFCSCSMERLRRIFLMGRRDIPPHIQKHKYFPLDARVVICYLFKTHVKPRN